MTKKTPEPTKATENEVDKLKPAATFESNGAITEPTIKERVDMKHPAVDDEPRKGLPPESNQIDFNDPGKFGQEAVEDNLKEQGKA